MKKRILAVVLGAVMVMSLAGCGSGTSGEDKKASSDGEKTYTIGISQFAEHGSLDNCREGFLEGLKEEGIEEGKNLTVSVKNAAADQGTAKQISDSFVSDKVDLICAIATPSAQAAYNSAMDSEIPRTCLMMDSCLFYQVRCYCGKSTDLRISCGCPDNIIFHSSFPFSS